MNINLSFQNYNQLYSINHDHVSLLKIQSTVVTRETFNTAIMYQAFNHGQKSLLEAIIH